MKKSLILFIVPAFVCLIMFMNLELRLILMIMRTQSENGDVRGSMCKFNLMAYGSMIVFYPILYYSNLSPFLYLAFCLILLPQIVTNGQQSHRPNLNSAYYKHFIPVRYLLLVHIKIMIVLL